MCYLSLYIYIYIYIFISIYLSNYLSICLSVWLSVCLSILSYPIQANLSIHPSIHLSIFIYLYIYIFTFISIHLHLYIYIFTFISLHLYLSIFLFSYIYIYMYVYLQWSTFSFGSIERCSFWTRWDWTWPQREPEAKLLCRQGGIAAHVWQGIGGWFLIGFTVGLPWVYQVYQIVFKHDQIILVGLHGWARHCYFSLGMLHFQVDSQIPWGWSSFSHENATNLGYIIFQEWSSLGLGLAYDCGQIEANRKLVKRREEQINQMLVVLEKLVAWWWVLWIKTIGMWRTLFSIYISLIIIYIYIYVYIYIYIYVYIYIYIYVYIYIYIYVFLYSI